MKPYLRLSLRLALLLLPGLPACTDATPSRELLVRAEELISDAPDSALLLLNTMPAESIRNKAEYARYALLHAEAADRAGCDTCASQHAMLEAAWEYYKERPHELRNQCRTLYFRGRTRLRQGDKPGALREFLKIEEMLREIDEPYYLGLLYLRIGEVYHNELNFVRAYRYYRDARDLFIRSEDPRRTTEALLGMTASALRMRDLERAQRSCTMALDLAEELQDDSLKKQSLAHFATLYTVADTLRIPGDLLQSIECSVRNDTTAAGLCTRAQA